MFKIAVMPTSGHDSVTLFARTDEWQRFIAHLQKSPKRVFANLLIAKIDKKAPTSKVTLTKKQAITICKLAGVSL